MDAKSHNSDSFKVLLDRARRYCSLAEQCEDTVRQKLVTWGASPAESDEVVARLNAENYLNNERYARAYCESKIVQQQWGRQKVLYHLRLKHLPRAAVEAGMAAVSEEAYFDALAKAAEKKLHELRNASDDPVVIHQKLTAFLVSRGFTQSEINQATKNILDS